MKIETFPSGDKLAEWRSLTPEYMRPSMTPYAAVVEGFLKDSDCNAIIQMLYTKPSYKATGCGATTQEIDFDPSLDPIEATARGLNEMFFGYDLDDGQHSWVQTYSAGDSYQRHMDDAPGQTRKLTAVVMLSDLSQYSGGDLKIHITPKVFRVPKTRGTIVVFPSWVDHEVTEVRRGMRQTVNMGFWGPPFK